MKIRPEFCAVAAVALLLTGCTSAASVTPRVTVTVTAPVPTPTLKVGDAAPWNLNAVCAAQGEIDTLEQWRRDQSKAGRLSKSGSDAILQAEAVQFQEMAQYGVPSSVEASVAALANGAGSLAHPKIDLASAEVLSAQNAIRRTCMSSGLTVGVYAQGG